MSAQPAARPLEAADGSPVLSVSQVTHLIRDTLERHVGTVWVTGEVSNFRRPASGHCYFTLKDEFAQINVVMWRSMAGRLKFEVKDGLAIVACGEITVYEPRGQYQIVLCHLEPMGAGALQIAFQQLKEKLRAEGLFDPGRKRPLPLIPNRIAIVTSPTGAAIRDMLNVIYRRFPGARVLVAPVRVQGEGAAADIVEAIDLVNHIIDVDVMIVGRGGGSLEDLWPFNEESVARAIAAARVPVISAVGHEIDFTIADFVADVRALTPTDAAGIVVPDVRELMQDLNHRAVRLGHGLLGRLDRAAERLNALRRSYVLRKPLEDIRRREQRLDDLAQQFYRANARLLETKRQSLGVLGTQLESLSPLAVLARGYSITLKEPQGTIVRRASEVAPGDLVRTRVARGEILSRVESGEKAAPKRSSRPRSRKK